MWSSNVLNGGNEQRGIAEHERTIKRVRGWYGRVLRGNFRNEKASTRVIEYTLARRLLRRETRRAARGMPPDISTQIRIHGFRTLFARRCSLLTCLLTTCAPLLASFLVGTWAWHYQMLHCSAVEMPSSSSHRCVPKYDKTWASHMLTRLTHEFGEHNFERFGPWGLFISRVWQNVSEIPVTVSARPVARLFEFTPTRSTLAMSVLPQIPKLTKLAKNEVALAQRQNNQKLPRPL